MNNQKHPLVICLTASEGAFKNYIILHSLLVEFGIMNLQMVCDTLDQTTLMLQYYDLLYLSVKMALYFQTVLPSSVLPLSESTIVSNYCNQLRSWRALSTSELPLTINKVDLGYLSFHNTGLYEKIKL